MRTLIVISIMQKMIFVVAAYHPKVTKVMMMAMILMF
jgi:hypothetical protein